MITTKNIIKKFLHGMQWNAFETLFYHALLLTHQLCLYKHINSPLYGLIGTTFATIYLIITFTNCGFDQSISSFISCALKTKQLFKRYIVKQCILNVCIITIVGALFCLFQTKFSLLISLVIAGIMISESAKKTLLTILQLAFYNKQTAFIESISIILYVALVWLGYFYGFALSLELIFIPMLATSLLSVIFLGYFTYCVYRKIKPEHIENENLSFKTIFINRLFIWGNQISHSIFSSNFLVPLFAYQFGFSYAGILKLASTISYSITSIMRKIGGITSSALFAHTKDQNNRLQQENFLIATNTIHQMLYGIIIFFSINCSKILAIKQIPLSSFSISLAYFFLLVTISESLFIAYESFLIAHQQAHYVALFNVLTMGIVYGSCVATHRAPLQTIIILLIIRIITFIFLSAFTFYRWKIKPSWHIKPQWLAAVLVASLAFFVFV